MKHSDQNTAILLFAEKAGSASNKQLIEKNHQNRLLHEKMLQRTLLTVEKSGIPYYWINEEKQRGRTFGTRLTNAMRDVFEQGFDHLIVVGSDTPQLSTSHLHKAAIKLKDYPLLLGPSIDGGVYLLAIRRSHFHFFEKLEVQWQCGEDYKAILRQWQAMGNALAFLNVLADIDTAEDFIQISSHLGHTVLYKLLFYFLWNREVVFDLIGPPIKEPFNRRTSGRPPPFVYY
jgi:hypothetical protein